MATKCKRVFYLGSYVGMECPSDRAPLPSCAATDKMRYIAECLNDHYNVTIITPGFSRAKGNHEETVRYENGIEVQYLRSWGDGRPGLTYAKARFASKEMRQFLRDRVCPTDVVILYSQPWANYTVISELRRRRIPFVLEVEEIYGSNKFLHPMKRLVYRGIEAYSLTRAPHCIVASELLAEDIGRPCLVCHGRYAPVAPKAPAGSDTTRILYSGAIDAERGAFLFLESLFCLAPKLRDKLDVIMTGFFHGGCQETTAAKFQSRCEAARKHGIRVRYLGTLSEPALDGEMAAADICVAPQLIANPFSARCFPSKIVKYMLFGNLVVAGELPALMRSPLAEYAITYAADEPRLLAAAIERAVASHREFRQSRSGQMQQRLQALSSRFQRGLIEVIQGAMA